MNYMTTKLSPWLKAQFGHPSGFWGAVAGIIMARRTSNRERARFTIDLLELRAGDRVLEIGFGPGVALERISRSHPDVFVAGIDHSEVMLRQATRRNVRAIAEGRVTLALAPVEQLPPCDEPYDKIFAINSVDFWDEPVRRIEILRSELLAPGGRLLLTVQPRGARDSASAVERARDRLLDYLSRAGFVEPSYEIACPGGAPAVAVWGSAGI